MDLLQQYKADMRQELGNILGYWMMYSIDEAKGGFYGKIDNSNIPEADAPKGLVLNARILWTFSSAMLLQPDEQFGQMAERAFNYIEEFFFDKEYGGVYWMVDAQGAPLNTRKQIYALAFCLYGVSEYYAATKNSAALNLGVELFNVIEEHSYDIVYGGYFEAFARDWQPLDDLRLSAKDANEKKTMNTHLHIIEAYCSLYKVWPDALLKQKIIELLEIFDQYMFDENSGHLNLFFDEQWNVKPDVISYGHDIEAAWLLQECAEIVGDEHWITVMKQHAVSTAIAAAEGLDADGGLWYELEPAKNHLVKEKHWWPQAEAMVGFFNAWQLTGDKTFLQKSNQAWQFTKKHIIDDVNGEWFWGVDGDHNIMPGQDKAGFWKCPYHNARACMEILKRVSGIQMVGI
jgi:mannobiose 2-epimerase